MTPKAFLFDLNGTMIDDMQYHITAWHDIIHKLGYPISMEQMKEECYGKNNELLERIFPGRFTEQEKEEMSIEKEKLYRKHFKPHLKLLPGLEDFIKQAYAEHIKMAIGSAAIMSNIDFVLDGLQIRNYFSAIVSADDVIHSKPDPETYLKCAAALGMEPEYCIVFEDAPKGVEAALNANMPAVVLTTLHEEAEFSQYPNIIDYTADYTGKLFKQITSGKRITL
jgi:beta-phosphoglucomutase